MAAQVVGKPVVGQPGEIHTSAKNVVGTECPGLDANGYSMTYIYLKGVGSTVAGSAVTYDEAGATTLLAANAKGPLAWATGATVASTWGWYVKNSFAGISAAAAASSGDNATLGRETADGSVGDGRSAGDEIIGAFSRGASASGAQLVQIVGAPVVNDFEGA